MFDSRLPLTVRPVAGGYAIEFADGGQHIFIQGGGGMRTAWDRTLTLEQAQELAVTVAKALSAVWIEPMWSMASTPDEATPPPPSAVPDSTAA